MALTAFAPQSWAATIVDDKQQAAAARSILEPWQGAQATPAERFLHIVCWTPNDRKFPAEYQDRLSRMLLHIQDFYAQEMERNGFEERSFNLQRDDGRVLLHEIRGRHPTSHYGLDSGSEIRKECVPQLENAGIDADDATIAIFCNLAEWDETELKFSHKSPYYAGGSYRSGTAWQLDSPELDTLNLAKASPLIDDGQYGRISLGKHNSIFIGGMAHELGHAFGLPHVKERPDEGVRGTALMGSGNQTYGDELRGEGRGSFLTFAHALRLASHPLFCRRLESNEHEAEASIKDLIIRADGKSIAVSGTIAGQPPVYGVVAYFDPEGNADYNQTSATAVP
ncbi:MAG TPA: glycosyl hydrolase, partial [Lacipirellula sp.]